ncbi:MAG: hypothetical protein KGP28_04155 [Bdellovibrionales bacterium]|nr:hypothetical protein [Bdellovibrionales bacterium]
MFLRFILVSTALISSTPAFSEKYFLLDSRQTSGFTTMADAFESECHLNSSGKLSGILRRGRTESGGWISQKKIKILLTFTETKEVIALVQASQNGPFREEPAICDTGDLLIRGSSGKGSFPVIEIRDCARGITNESPSAKRLEEWVRHHCLWSS